MHLLNLASLPVNLNYRLGRATCPVSGAPLTPPCGLSAVLGSAHTRTGRLVGLGQLSLGPPCLTMLSRQLPVAGGAAVRALASAPPLSHAQSTQSGELDSHLLALPSSASSLMASGAARNENQVSGHHLAPGVGC